MFTSSNVEYGCSWLQGETFSETPPIFEQGKERLKDRITVWGYQVQCLHDSME